MTRIKSLSRQYVNQEKDAKERVHVLRLQAMAWRHIAMIACVDPTRGATLSRWMIFKTLPFTDGAAVEGFIKETEKEAELAGFKCGVFQYSSLAPATCGGARE